jgi:DNA-directed RNA polymerase subunit RPC12/RpoP
MEEVVCPYCKEHCVLCTDDGAFYENEGRRENECEHCGKKFMVESRMCWYFYGEPCECLNDETKHNWVNRFVGNAPRSDIYKKCSECGKYKTEDLSTNQK